MSLKKRLIAVAAVIVMAAAVLYGSILGMRTEEEGGDNRIILPWLGQKETIYFWYSDESMTNYINSAAVAFGEKEDVRVIPVLTSESEYLEALNEASLHSKQVPDAYIISHDLLEKAYLAGLASPIADVMEVCNEENFPKAALSAISYEDMQVAYPLFFETSALVYNETYLAQWAKQAALREILGVEDEEGTPDITGLEIDTVLWEAKTQEYISKGIPSTVDDILNIAHTFDVPEGVEGVLKWDVSDIFYNYWIVGNYAIVGGDTGDDHDNVNIDNPEIIQCLEVYKALNQFFYIESDTVTYDSVVEDFCAGKIVFTIATTDVAQKLADAKADGSLGFDYGIAPLPEVSTALESRAMSVTNAVAVNGYSEHKELANKFAAYLVTECTDSLYDRTGKVSANLNANLDNGALQIFKQVYADSVPLPKMMETANFWMHLEALFAKVWNGADVTELVHNLSNQIILQLNATQ